MKIVSISDTHSFHRKVIVPNGDMLIHAGDITFKGELTILKDFSDWLKELPHKYKIVVMGNHELNISKIGPNRTAALKMIADAGAIYLEDSSVEIEGFKIHGSPVSPFFFDWEWNRQRGPDIDFHWKKIPDDTNILITHGPSSLALAETANGENVGCVDLSNKILNLKNLKLHCFGHIHHSYGLIKKEKIIFANSSICSESYKPINKPHIINL